MSAARCTLLERLGITTNGTRRFPVYDPYGPGLPIMDEGDVEDVGGDVDVV